MSRLRASSATTIGLATAALMALGSGACGKAPTPLGFPGPLRSPSALADPEIRAIATLLRFEDHRSYDPAVFEGFAQNDNEEVRRRAATAAGRIGDPTAVPLLLRLLESDPSPAVRADAAFALGELAEIEALTEDGAAAGERPAKIEALNAALEAARGRAGRQSDPTSIAVAVEAVAALGKVGGEEARSIVRRTLAEAARAGAESRTAVADAVAAEALLTVWKFDDGPGNVEAALPFLSTTDPELRWRAAYALMRGSDPSALRPLLDHAAHSIDAPGEPGADHRVRAHTARALSATTFARATDGSGTPAIRQSALSWLTGALSDPHPHVRVNAVRALGGYGEAAPVGAVAALLHDPEPGVATAAAGAMAALGTASAPALRGALLDNTLPLPLRGAILPLLAPLDPATADATFRRWAGADPVQRYFAAAAVPAFAATSPDAAVAVASCLAHDEDPRIALAALALGGVEASTAGDSTMRRLLLEAAASPDPARRTMGLRYLATHGTAADLDTVLEAFWRSAAEIAGSGSAGTDPLARQAALAALRAMGSIGEREGIAPTVLGQRLFAGPRPSDRWILRAAAEFGDGWGGRPAAVAGEDLAFYEDIVRRYVAAPLAGEARPRAVITTPHGPIVLELMGEEAPLTVHNFVQLAGSGFYDGGVWHRVIPNFVLQDGGGAMPGGGPGWSIRDEINRLRYDRGMLGMALSGPDTGGSQWFITHSPQPHLDGGYTIFGRVIEGMRAADSVLQGDPIPSIEVRP